ncbi:hypothetical protein BH11CYA1_BH11CYA1_00970 [soil metagenome]
MTREAAETVENRRHKVEPGTDSLQSYRVDQHQPNRLLGEGFKLPVKGALDIPNIWKIDSSDKSRDFSPEKPVKTGHDHVVTNKDTLWRIAKESLQANGDSTSNTHISKRIQSIIKANSEEHPRLARNPHPLPPGMKLHVPDQDGQNIEHRRHEKAVKPERAERTERTDRFEDKPRAKDRQRAGRDRHSEDSNDSSANEGDGGRLAKAMKQFGHDLADAAKRIAEKLGTIGDCAKGPRLTFKELGFHLPPAVATEQGRMLKESGLFHEVPRDEVRPGDYGVRDWNHRVTKRHGGVNKGDSFIVTAVSAHGALRGANDHTFNVPEDGGRYRNLKFMRPTPEFYKRYGGNI